MIGRCAPVAAALLILSFQLFIPTTAGLADNGDFFNTLWPYRMRPADTNEHFFRFVTPYYRETDRSDNEWFLNAKSPLWYELLLNGKQFTTEWLMPFPTVMAWKLLAPNRRYPLVAVGVTHLLVFLVAVWLMLPVLERLKPKLRLAAWAAILLVFCDGAYSLLLNSFYLDTASLLFFLLSAAFYARLKSGAGQERNNVIGLMVVTLLFLTSKLQHALLAGFIVPFLWWTPEIRRQFSVRTLAAVAASLALFLTYCFWRVSGEYSRQAAYSVIFQRVLPNVPDRTALLQELGLPASMITFSGKSAYHPESALQFDGLRQQVNEKLDHGGLIRFYLRHPEWIGTMLLEGLADCSRERQDLFGNWVDAPGYLPNHLSHRFSLLSDLRRFVFDQRPWLYAFYFLAVLFGTTHYAFHHRRVAFGAILLLAAMAAFEFAVAALADCNETARHTFLVRLMMDTMVVATLILWLGRRPDQAVR